VGAGLLGAHRHRGAAFRAYLLKGGFAIFDDFEQEQWDNFEFQMRRVLPDARFVKLDQSHKSSIRSSG
jgi:hypothetical protein